LDVATSLRLKSQEEREHTEDAPTEYHGYKAQENEVLVLGIASSTSVDWHGTEMSLQALQRMVVQFKRGVSHVPSHMDDEWDQMIGRTVDAEIEQSTVVNPAPGMEAVGEPQYIARVHSVVYTDTEKGKLLVNRINRGDTIGWSIGGWFTDMRVIYDEDDEKVERVIIEDVELDHLAVTRKPSNPDSWLEGVRSKASEAVVAFRSKDVRLKEDEEEDEPEEAADDAKDEIDESAGEEEEMADEEEKKERAEEDEEEQEDHDEGAIKDDEDQIEDLEDDKKDDEEDLEDEEKSNRSIIPFQDLAIEYDRDWNWDTTARDEILGDSGDNWKRYRDAHIYYDSDKPEDNKGAYKLPIARMVDDKLMAIWNGVVAAMAAVNGARGGVDIGDDERKKAHAHLSQYYKKADKEPPEFKSERAEPVYEEPPGNEPQPGDGTDSPVDPTSEVTDEFADEGPAKIRGEALGCGLFAHETEGGRFMPCKSQGEYQDALLAEDANPDGVATLTGEDEMGGVELSRPKSGRHIEKIEETDDSVTIKFHKSDNYKSTDRAETSSTGHKAHSPEDSLMSIENDSTESASTTEEAVFSALNDKVDALTRSVEALMGSTQAPTPEPESQLDALTRSMEKLASLVSEQKVEAAAPVAEEDPEKVQLRERLAAMEKKVSRMAAKPHRRASTRFRDEVRIADKHPDARVLSILEEQADGGASALATVARDFESVIYWDKRIHGKDKQPDRNDLQEALRAIYMAASVDGIIHNPDFS
jgi:hypothetical protein|tara:strand:- start:5202 stop:7472 length:2271 start_codon:yes stop_codon:yes gene_type:complete